ncbi:hypothetical protein [Nocardia sp. NRRL S-836]|uniref:hypothetical protein n=1 Tax=Nocardia sp. NRRL S-836 TaxID=1519492 RepID=UPI0012FC2B56|nr:hypothetical protein [Nocardia sp. NRRL S-836]
MEITGYRSPVDDEWSAWTHADARNTVCRASVSGLGNRSWSSLVAQLKAGDRLTLEWHADLPRDPTYFADLTSDALWIRIDRAGRWWHRLLNGTTRRRLTQPLWLRVDEVTARRDDPNRRFVKRYGFVVDTAAAVSTRHRRAGSS